jgi:ribosome-associated heat shock protein Hsp15
MDVLSSARVDAWVWAVRLAKTRSAATAACKAGHVQVNGERAKPARPLRIGDEVRLRSANVERTVTVSRLVSKRVGVVIAAECFVDLTPPPPQKEVGPTTVLRDRGAGRPTKRERRDLDRLRGRTGAE